MASAGPVHPRVCGELRPPDGIAAHPDGSSPRVRGTLALRLFVAAQRRFIPACAGNSVAVVANVVRRAVHPRVCGELIATPDALRQRTGSSPRVRGTRHVLGRVYAGSRFIPACAGNSLAAPVIRNTPPVHPRVCGELGPNPRRPTQSDGSSPRVRGTPFLRPRKQVRLRFIPACAGNSPNTSRVASSLTVHPRVCGELL